MNRYVGIGSIVVAIIAICAVLFAVALKGGISTNAPSIVALIGFLSLLITGLLTAISVQSIGQRLNGHLQTHMQTVEAATKAARAVVEARELLEQNSVVLAANTEILSRVHRDTNTTLEEAKQTVVELRERLRQLQGERGANPPTTS